MNRDKRRCRSRRGVFPHAVGEPLEARRLLAASLLKDVNTGPIGSEPADFVEFKGAAYFAAEGPQGRELYRSVGTPGSAMVLADIEPGYLGSNPSHLTVVGDTLYFVAGAWTGDEGKELWKTDGTAARTVRVKDIVPGPTGSNPELLEAVDGRLYFVAMTPDGGEAVWTTDGTAAGTVPVADPAGNDDISEFEFLGDTLYFLSGDRTQDPRLWAAELDGASPPRLVQVFLFSIWSDTQALTAVGDRLVFTSPDEGNWPALWTSDGTTAGTHMVRTDGRLFVRRQFAVVGEWAYFLSGGLSGDEDLLRTDGENVEHVANVRRGRGGGAPGPMVVRSDGTIFFEAHDSDGSALWRSGGGEPTRELKPVPATSLTFSGDTLYFGSGGELWKSDGTEAGTAKVRDFARSYDGGPKEIAPFRDGVVFQADGVLSPGIAYEPIGEPWFSDGTPAGTYSLREVNPATLGSNIHYPPGPSHTGPVTINGRLLFGAGEGDGNVGLWTTDGTTAGTTPARSLDAYTLFALVAVSDSLALALVGDGGYAEVWRTDGTAAGTQLVAPVWVNSACDCNRLDSVTMLNGEMYFSGSPRPDNEGTGYVGKELMKSDGTPAGTVVVKDIATEAPGWNPGSYPTDLTTVGNYVYFTAMGGESRVPGLPNELWRSDGTEAGTVKVMEFDGTNGAANARDLFDAGGTLYFRTDAPVSQGWDDPVTEQIWKSDGTSAGTVKIADFAWPSVDSWGSDYPGSDRPGMAFVNGTVFFPASSGAAPDDVELWKTDGTPAGTVMVRDINPGAAASLPATLTPFGGRVYFSATDPAGGRELWSSDGTAAGTARVADLNPGPTSSNPVVWNEIDGRLYFTADDGTHGQELWSTDGTDSGSIMVHDVRPGAERPWEPAPQSPVGVEGPGGRRVVFWADDRLHGMEPWVTPVPQPDYYSFVVGRHVFYNNSRYDGRNPAANRGDDAAIAPDKRALRPGEAASFRNVTGYSRGINGVMVDVNTRLAFYDDLRFSFKVGNDDTPGDWATAPAPASLSRRNDGLPLDLDRWMVTWADGAIRNTWLEVTVEALLGGSVAATDVFYFGNVPGETGDAPPAGSGAVAVVSATDFARTRGGVPARVASLTSPFDHNRDGVLNVLDLNVVRGNMMARLFPPTAPAQAWVSVAYQRGLLLDREGERFGQRPARLG